MRIEALKLRVNQILAKINNALLLHYYFLLDLTKSINKIF